MGRSYTPKYALRLVVPGVLITPSGWSVGQDGQPTDARLREHVERFERSSQPGGANAALAEAFGPIKVSYAEIRRNIPGGAVVATYRPAA